LRRCRGESTRRATFLATSPFFSACLRAFERIKWLRRRVLGRVCKL
jgi:hypothetical protein